MWLETNLLHLICYLVTVVYLIETVDCYDLFTRRRLI